MSIIEKLIKDVEYRCTGLEQKKKACIVLYVSAIIFVLMGIAIFFTKKNITLAVFFISEGVGQLFLAEENRKSLLGGSDLFVYFAKNKLGFMAAVSFSLTIFCRFYLAANALGPLQLNILISAVFSVIAFLSIYLFSSIRKEYLTGIAAFLITFSALFLGIVRMTGSNQLLGDAIGTSQMLYSGLQIIGVLCLRPVLGEIMNIIIWTLLFVFVMV